MDWGQAAAGTDADLGSIPKTTIEPKNSNHSLAPTKPATLRIQRRRAVFKAFFQSEHNI
jgi:hypothetical protein